MFRPTLRKMTQFNIDIVSDTVCPWCYVGKKKLEIAIAEYKKQNPGSQDSFATSWKAFYLNPDAPKTGKKNPSITHSPVSCILEREQGNMTIERSEGKSWNFRANRIMNE
jgi:predicted DsbA family dithiol-disulfide isomerase